MDDAEGLHLYRRSREQVTHVVMDLSGDAGALVERGEADLVVLCVQELAVFLLEGEFSPSQLVGTK